MFDPSQLRHSKTKPRVFIITDISNEPDDAESLVRYLLYSNEFETLGLVACTSHWMKHTVHPEDIHKILSAYETVHPNLSKHTHPSRPYPTPSSLRALVSTGPALYGKAALSPTVPLSPGAALLIQAILSSPLPLWILCWGGTNTLAQALSHPTRPATDHSKIRIYTISDQDPTGPWLRTTYPHLFTITSLHGWNQYGLATWSGISGEEYYAFDKGGPDGRTVSKSWLRENIQIGPFGGAAYPTPLFIPEGDTPTFLYLIPNGLGSSENPHWGSWGGRYIRSSPGDASSGHFGDAVDRVVGLDGRIHVSNQATIWRWRGAYQNDFAARMRWTLEGEGGNHPPVVVVNGSEGGPEPVRMEAGVEEKIELDAQGTYDPDGNELTLRWFQYKDVSATQWWVDAEVHGVEFVDQDEGRPGWRVRVKMPPAEKCAVDILTRLAQTKGQELHFILEVTDSGTPPLTTYKRVVVQITNPKLKGGQEKAAESIGER